jgi:hypothetical protein
MLQLMADFIYVSVVLLIVIAFGTARVMIFFGRGISAVLSPIIGSALSLGILLVLPITSNITLVLSLLAATGGTVAADFILQFVFKPVSDKVDDIIGDALFKASDRFADKTVQKLLTTANKEERLKLIRKQMMTNVIEFDLPISAQKVYEKILDDIEKSDFISKYEKLEIGKGEHLGILYIFFYIPRVDVSLRFDDYNGKSKITLTLSALDYYSLGSMSESLRANKQIDTRAANLMDDIIRVTAGAASELCPNDTNIKLVQETSRNVVRASTLDS